MRWCLILVCAGCGRLEFATQVDAARDSSAIDAEVAGAPIGYWPFDEGGGTAVLDASGNGNDGMLTPLVARIAGHIGGAVSFTGASDQEVDLGMPIVLELTGSMSLAAWVSATAFHLGNGTDDLIIGRDRTQTGWSLKGTEDCGTERFAFQIAISEGAIVERCSTTMPTIGVWYHVAGVYDARAQTMDIYVDGVLDDGTETGAPPPSQHQANDAIDIEIGNTNPTTLPRGGGSTWQGVIDEVRMYDRALSAAEVAVLAQ